MVLGTEDERWASALSYIPSPFYFYFETRFARLPKLGSNLQSSCIMPSLISYFLKEPSQGRKSKSLMRLPPRCLNSFLCKGLLWAPMRIYNTMQNCFNGVLSLPAGCADTSSGVQILTMVRNGEAFYSNTQNHFPKY